MSRSVSRSRTRSRSRAAKRFAPLPPLPTFPDAPQLPPLVCGIFNADGTLSSLSEQPDPRTMFCPIFNEMASKWGITARPLDAEEVAIARKLLAEREAGKAVSHV